MNALVVISMLVAAVAAAPVKEAALAAPMFYSGLPYGYPAQFAVAPIETRVHYAETPVVTGYSSQILKPAIGQVLSTPVLAAPAHIELNKDLEIKSIPTLQFASPLAYSNVAAPLAYSNINLDVPAPIPAGDAPAWEKLVSQEKVMAPARAVSKITPQVTNVVPEVNIQKVAIDVPVAQPYAHPVPVPVHTPVATPVLAPIAQYPVYPTLHAAPIAVKAGW